MLLSLFTILDFLLQVLIWIIVIQWILSLLVMFNVINTYNHFVGAFVNALDRMTRPLYRPIRKIMPDLGGIDFSPTVVILILILLRRLMAVWVLQLLSAGYS